MTTKKNKSVIQQIKETVDSSYYPIRKEGESTMNYLSRLQYEYDKLYMLVRSVIPNTPAEPKEHSLPSNETFNAKPKDKIVVIKQNQIIGEYEIDSFSMHEDRISVIQKEHKDNEWDYYTIRRHTDNRLACTHKGIVAMAHDGKFVYHLDSVTFMVNDSVLAANYDHDNIRDSRNILTDKS